MFWARIADRIGMTIHQHIQSAAIARYGPETLVKSWTTLTGTAYVLATVETPDGPRKSFYVSLPSVVGDLEMGK